MASVSIKAAESSGKEFPTKSKQKRWSDGAGFRVRALSALVVALRRSLNHGSLCERGRRVRSRGNGGSLAVSGIRRDACRQNRGLGYGKQAESLGT